MLRVLNTDKLIRYIIKHKKEIYCVYVGIEECWEDTFDEIYFHEMGFIKNNSIDYSDRGHPVAYIHYFDRVNENNLITEFKEYL